MSFYTTIVKNGYTLEWVPKRWLAEGYKTCYALDVPQEIRGQQHEYYDAGCYYRTHRIRNFAYANPR
jgi:hypothetical protein